MLSDSKISSLYFEALGSQHLREQDRTTVSRFALAVEAEARAQDTALIRQLVEALECCMDDVSDKLAQLEGASFNDTPELYAQEQIVEIANNAITAARARLTEKAGPNVP